MTEPFVIEGDLWLLGQEGGFAQDAWTLRVREYVSPLEALLSIVSNDSPGYAPLDDVVAQYFEIEREKQTGNRHIGQVRITIERIEEPENDG